MYAGSISKQGLLSAYCLGDTGLGACALASEFAKNRAADDKCGAHQADWRYNFTQKDGGEHDGRERLEVADNRDGLHGQLGDGAKVEQATDAGVDDAEHSDGAPIDACGDAGGEKRGSALGDERKDQRGHKGGAQLERGVLETLDVWRTLASDDHQRIAKCRGDAADDARNGHVAAETLRCNEKSAAGDGDKAGDFAAGQFFAKDKRREGHDDDGAAVVQQRGYADADRLVGAEQENPAGAQRGAREKECCGFAGTRWRLQLMALGDNEDGDKREGSQKGAQQHDIGARQRDSSGDDAVGAKQ